MARDTIFFSRGSRGCRHANPHCIDQHLVIRWLRGVEPNSHNWTPQEHTHK